MKHTLEEYAKFKSLLSWFVNQLNINNGILPGEKHSGQGYSRNDILKHYEQWRDYSDFVLDCSIQCGFQSAFSGSNYIHLDHDHINIRPKFDNKKQVLGLYIDINNENKDDYNEWISEIGTDHLRTCEELKLTEENKPNDCLMHFFDVYYDIIMKRLSLKKNNTEDKKLHTEGINKIYFGAPGCGKSYEIKKHLQDLQVSQEHIIRTTFHPEYSNSDFIGQIMPTVSGNVVKYDFNPGPFTNALITAYNTNDPVYFIIEELNRGNAPAIFGDVFQLLDRTDGTDGSTANESEYPISNPVLQKYLIEKVDSSAIAERLKNGVYIPSNLYVFATMNTSDQNVFTLDTAFKRRWNFEQISNTFDSDHKYKDWFVPGSNITWERFVTVVNEKIIDTNGQLQISEDKRIGTYFVKKDYLNEKENMSGNAKVFAYKVLEYIWDDVCRIGRDQWFNANYRTLEQVISDFISFSGDGKSLSVFKFSFDDNSSDDK